MERKLSKPYIYGLDFLRVVSACIIVFIHYQQVFECRYQGINFFDGAFNFGIFVEFFFMISGFFAVYTERKIETGGGYRPYLSRLLHKLKRIYPLPTIACLVTIIIKTITYQINYDPEKLAEIWNVKAMVANFFLIFRGWPYFSMQGFNNPTWYLCILIQCYIAYELVQWMVSSLKLSKILNILFRFICSALIIVVYKCGLVEYHSFLGLFSFSIGVAVCYMLEAIPDSHTYKKYMYCVSIPTILISVFICYRYLSYQHFIILFGVCPWLIILAYCLKDIKCEPIRLLGSVSFSVYIWHYPIMAFEKLVLSLTNVTISRTYGTMFLFTVFAWVLGWIIHKYIETPIARRLK